MKKAVYIIFFLIGITSCAPRTNLLKKDGISINYPSEWAVKNLDNYIVLVSEPPKKELSVMTTFDIQRHSGYSDLNRFFKDYQNKMIENEIFKNFKIKSNQNTTFKGYSAINYRCTAIVQAIPIEWESIIFIANEKVYQLTTTSLTYKFNSIKKKTDAIFKSFDFVE